MVLPPRPKWILSLLAIGFAGWAVVVWERWAGLQAVDGSEVSTAAVSRVADQGAIIVVGLLGLLALALRSAGPAAASPAVPPVSPPALPPDPAPLPPPPAAAAPRPPAGAEAVDLALAAAQVSVWEFHLPSGQVELDERWEVMIGGEPVPTRSSIRELFRTLHPSDRGRGLRAVQACFDGQVESYDAEYRVRSRRGEWLWISSRGRVTERDVTGRAVRLTGTNIDIHRRKLAELELARQAEFLNALQRTTLDVLQYRERGDILPMLARRAALLLSATRARIALVEDSQLVLQADEGEGLPDRRGPLHRESGGPEWHVIKFGGPLLFNEPDHGGAAVALFPIVLDGEGLGVLRCDRPAEAGAFSGEERQRGLVLARLAALVIRNATVYEEALRVAEERSAALRRQERDFRSVIENLKQGFYTASPRSMFRYSNEAVTAFTGATPEQMRGTSSFRFVAREDRARVIANYRRWAAGPENHVTCEFCIESEQGGRKWVEQSTYIQRDDQGQVVEFRNFLRDISERKQVEDALRDSEARFRALFDHSPVGIALLTLPEGRVEELNAAAQAMFRIEERDVRGLTSTELGVWARPDEREAYLVRLRAAGQVSGFEARMRRGDGTEFPSLYSGAVLAVGDTRFSLNIIQDISALEAAKQARATSELQFRSVFTESPVPAVVMDLPESRVRAVNSAGLALFGFAEAEVLGRTTIELNLWPDVSVRERILRVLRDGGAVRGLPTVMLNKRGEPVQVVFNAVRVVIGDRPSLLATIFEFGGPAAVALAPPGPPA